MLFLDYDNKNNPSLLQLPKYKDKEKWQKVFKKTKLFVQNLRTSIYRRPCLELSRLLFRYQKENIEDACTWSWRQRYIIYRRN